MENTSLLIDVLRTIEGDIHTPVWLTLIAQVASGLLGSIIGAWSAIYASNRLHSVTKEEDTLNIYVGIEEEIKCIKKMVEDLIATAHRESFVKTSVFETADRFCPIYIGSSPKLGLLDREASMKITRFYSQLLTIQPQGGGGPSGTHYLIANLRNLVDSADLAMQSMQNKAD